MKDSIRFIHCSDIHLGANPYQVKERFEDMGKVFKDVVDYALKLDDLDFFVIGGDLFHKKILNAETLDQCIEILKPLNDKNIPIYVTEGNHDKSNIIHNYSWLEFLSKKKVINLLNPYSEDKETIANEIVPFDEEERLGTYIQNDDYIIYGLGYPGVLSAEHIKKLVDGFIPDTEDKIRVAILHTGVDKFCTEDMGGIRYEDSKILSDNVDYIALGHIHDEYHDDEGKFYNPGCLETSSLKRTTKNKGFYDVTIDKESKKVDAKFVEVVGRKIINVEVNVSECLDEEEARETIINEVKKAVEEKQLTNEERGIIRVKVKGETDGDLIIDLNKIKTELKNEYNLLICEIVNAITSSAITLDVQDESLTREDYEKLAIEKLVEKRITSDDDSDEVVALTKSIMQGASEKIEWGEAEGLEIKNQILDFVRNKIKSKK